ncbi:MAG: ComEC/Rec2 family competence protein [Pseudomonadota bacterium]|nr:ComEC/Rec2 family competence protein [Pseudomonadota bacterium]
MAIVCAEPLPESSFKQALKLSSLLHIIVVSGTHLLILELILNKTSLVIPRLKILIPIFLVGFAFVTFLSPPAIRALVHMAVSKTSESKKLFWNPMQLSWLSSFVVLSIFPEWLNSYSLLLSTAASLSVTVFFRANISTIKKHTLTYLIMAIFLLPIGLPHPLAILFNVVFVPIVGGILFPLNLACFFWHDLSAIVDCLWAGFNESLLYLTNGLSPLGQRNISIRYLWILLFLMQISLIFHKRKSLPK